MVLYNNIHTNLEIPVRDLTTFFLKRRVRKGAKVGRFYNCIFAAKFSFFKKWMCDVDYTTTILTSHKHDSRGLCVTIRFVCYWNIFTLKGVSLFLHN